MKLVRLGSFGLSMIALCTAVATGCTTDADADADADADSGADGCATEGTDCDPGTGTGEETTDGQTTGGQPDACQASDTGVLAFFALELGTLPTGDLEVEPLLDTACTVSTVSEADADLVVTTVLQCAAQDLGEHEVIFTTPVPSGAHPAWQDGDEVRLAVQRTDDPDTIEIHNTSVGIRTVDGSLLFAGVGDTIVLDGLGNEFTGTPNDNPVTAVLAPLSLETTLDVCGEPSEEFASAPIEVSYTLGESELALLGNAEGQLEVDGRTFAVLQESAHLSASGHAGFGLQLAVIALE